MDDPIKIIWKLKNKNKNVHYHVYIFIGDIKSKSVIDILNKIAPLNLYDALTTLSQKEHTTLINNYGEYWYEKIFISHHIHYIKTTLRSNTAKKKELVEKLGEEWYKKHISNWVSTHKIIYSYSAVIKEGMERKLINRKRAKEAQFDENIDFRTSKQKELQTGGSIFDITNDEISEETNDDMDNDTKTTLDVDIDKNLSSTNKVIKDIISTDPNLSKNSLVMTEFDTKKDEHLYDDVLKDVFAKSYVQSNYIFKDDTVKTIKKKICTSIEQDPFIGTNAYLIPSRVYLWSEYTYNGNLEKVMIGQKWIKRNDLLQIDVEPNSNIAIYKKLRGNLKLLRDSIRRLYGDKIKREDDEHSLLEEYTDYYTNNELFMIDLYHELGKEPLGDQEDFTNLYDVYIRIYFPKVKKESVSSIVNLINGKNDAESTTLLQMYTSLRNDIFLENEVTRYIEVCRRDDHSKYKNILKENYITQAVIHVYLRTKKDKNNESVPITKSLDLRRIFDNFIVTPEYPLAQFQSIDGQTQFKWHTETIFKQSQVPKDNTITTVTKWFDIEPYGVSFKFKNDEYGTNKYLSVNLTDTGKIEYKTQWKESDKASTANIKKTYAYIRKLLLKLKNENKFDDVEFEDIDDVDFKYAFVNTIQRFVIPNNFARNDNDLSDFARYFFPYVTLVIDPRKRLSKILTNKSKSGTYLRYKRIPKYESNERIENRILYFIRNYDYGNEQALASEIAKQFNITDERALEHINNVLQKNPHIHKSRKILKKFENIPKYKPPGIGIDIQGKLKDEYKMRITGARNLEQLTKITSFMEILIFLYYEVYLLKNPDRQILKENLKKVLNIAKRRNKVEEFVKPIDTVALIKQMTSIDAQRLGYAATKGLAHYSRECQSSGDDVRRRPELVLTTEELENKGYRLNNDNGFYERKVTVDKKQTIIRAIKLPSLDSNNQPTGKYIYYISGPETNGEYVHVGFLTKSINPYGLCMPCSFKKDQYLSKNIEKKNFFMKCLGDTKLLDTKGQSGNKLYVLQDTHKINEGRIGMLPKPLEVFLNVLLKKEKKIKNNYFVGSKTGYYFKYGVSTDTIPLLSSLSAIFDIQTDTIIKNIVTVLNEDKQDRLFTSLKNGDIKTQFQTKEKFFEFINNTTHFDFELMSDVLSMPGVFTKHGINMVIFKKIVRNSEQSKIIEDYVIACQNMENSDNIYDKNRTTVFMIYEPFSLRSSADNGYYYPIVMAVKEEINEKDVKKLVKNETKKVVDEHMTLIKHFKYTDEENNIVKHISNYYSLNCNIDKSNILANANEPFIAKKIYRILVDLKDKEWEPKHQIIDTRNKCIYLITGNNMIIPTKPSGSIGNLDIKTTYDKWISDLHTTLDKLSELHSKTKIPVKPIGVYYSNIEDGKLRVLAVTTKSGNVVPVTEVLVPKADIVKQKLIYEKKQLYTKLDKDLALGPTNVITDKRIVHVSQDKFENEEYELFRYEFSEMLDSNPEVKAKLVKLVEAKNINSLRLYLYKLCDSELYSIYKQYVSSEIQEGGGDSLVNIRKHDISDEEYAKYKVNNNRYTCSSKTAKHECASSLHCSYAYGKCKFTTSKLSLIKYVTKISDELMSNSLRAWELLKKEGYYVSNIVDQNIFTERPGQTMIKSNNINLQKKLSDLFGKNVVPTIGKEYKITMNNEIEQNNINNPLIFLGDYYIQKIVTNNNTIFRAFANNMYWQKFPDYDIVSRNLGYFSVYQTDLSNYYKNLTINWLLNKQNKGIIQEHVMPLIEQFDFDKIDAKQKLKKFIVKLSTDIVISTPCLVELFVLNTIYNIPIVVYNNDHDVIHVLDSGLKKSTNVDKKSCLHILFNYSQSEGVQIPVDISSIYYI